MQQTLRLTGHVPSERARQDPYLYLPFAVPAGARRIHVAYRYSEPVNAPLGLGPGNAVDIGIFDSRGHGFLDAPGFRGWSGAARSEFEITPDTATPGYIAGALFPGEWNLILGLARLEPHGVKYDVEIKIDSDWSGIPTLHEAPEPSRTDVPSGPSPDVPNAPQPVARAHIASPGEGRWMKGDLHCHTLHSDGAGTVREMAEHAVALGLDFLSVTDHNTTTHHAELDALAAELPIVLIPGEEVTTYWGHANTWGLREWIEFRCADQDSIQAVLQHVKSRGALLSINHAKCIGPPWLLQGWDAFPAMEVWQAPWRFYNWESLERWDGLLASGSRVVAVGGSDTHWSPPSEPRHPHGLAEPTTWVYASEPTEGGVLEAIRAGRAFITDSPRSPTHLALYADEDADGKFEKMMGDTVASGPVRFRVDVTAGREKRLWLTAGGETIDIIPIEEDDTRIEFTLDTTGRRYVRAELRGHRGRPERGEVVWAMTNPIWVSA